MAPQSGTLLNGLNYVVLSHPSARDELCVRLVVQSGSLDENEDERGFAHLIQHLAADRLGQLAPPALQNYIQEFGLGEAHTAAAYTHTTHAIDFTFSGSGRLEESLGVLRQYADGLSFSAEDVARVAKLVTAELPSTSDRRNSFSREEAAILYRDSKIPDHDPQLVPTRIEQATPERLHAFYRKTYLPTRMTVVIVGSLDAAFMIEKIVRCFETLAQSAAAQPVVRPSAPPPLPQMTPSVVTLPRLPPNYQAVELAAIRTRFPETPVGRRAELVHAIAATALETRLSRVRMQDQIAVSNQAPPMVLIENPSVSTPRSSDLGTALGVSTFAPYVSGLPLGQMPPLTLDLVWWRTMIPRPSQLGRVFGISEITEANSVIVPGAQLIRDSILVAGREENWIELVKFIETELRRVRTEGFTAEEIAEAWAIQLQSARDRLRSSHQLFSEGIADEIAKCAGEGRPWQTPAQHFAIVMAARDITGTEISRELANFAPGDASHLVLWIGGDRKVSSDKLLSAYTSSAKRPLESRAPVRPLTFKATPSKRAGPVHKTHIDDLDLTLAEFENGVRVNFRPAHFDDERFRLCIAFPKSWANSPANAPGTAEAAGYAFLHGSTNQQNSVELDRLSVLHDIRSEFDFDRGNPALLIDAPNDQLEFVFQLLQARFSTVNWSPSNQPFFLPEFHASERQKSWSPYAIALEQALKVSANNDPRVVIMPIGHVDFKMIQSEYVPWIERHLLKGSLEIGIVGDLSVDRLIAAAAITVGNLHARSPLPKPDAPLKLPQQPIRQELIAHLPQNLGVSCALWPANLPDNHRADAAISLAGDILQERLAAVLRGTVGTTNSPEIQFHRDFVQRDFAFVHLLNFFPPATLTPRTEASLRLAARFAESGATPDELARARDEAMARAENDLRSGTWWLRHVVCLAQSRPGVLEMARHLRTDFETLTLDEVNSAARIFTSDRAVALAFRPSPPKDRTEKPLEKTPSEAKK